jgi:hypothetical protein
MKRLWPRTLTWQLVTLLLLALVASQAVTFAILHDERRGTVEALAREQVLERAASLVRLTDSTVTVAERRGRSAPSPPASSASGSRPSRGRCRRRRGGPASRPQAGGPHGRRPDAGGAGGAGQHRPPPMGRQRWRDQWRMAAGEGLDMGEPPQHLPASGLLIAIRLDEALWLNAAMILPPDRPGFGPTPLAALLAAAIAISLVASFSLRRLPRPVLGKQEHPRRRRAVAAPLAAAARRTGCVRPHRGSAAGVRRRRCGTHVAL